MSKVNFDPNLNFSGNMATKTVRLVFGEWLYRKEITVTVVGNCSGLSNIETAIDVAYNQLPRDDFGMPYIVLEDGDKRLYSADDDELGEDFLQNMLISAEIVGIQSAQKHQL